MKRTRVLGLEKIKNFGDIGGLPISGGGKLKQGLLYRSAEISEIAQKDWNRFLQLGIKCIIDLRTPNERSAKPHGLKENHIRVFHIPILSEEKDLSRWEFAWFLIKKGRSLDFEEYMRRFYHRLAFERTEQTKTIFQIISDAENLPVVIHCTGGKDRTGFIAALVQLLVGVSQELVIEDYLLSNQAITNQMAKIESNIRWMSLGQISPERVRPLLEVRKDYLHGVLEEIYSIYKTIDRYLLERCGLDLLYIERVRDLLIER